MPHNYAHQLLWFCDNNWNTHESKLVSQQCHLQHLDGCRSADVGVFLTVFAVFPLEPIADTLVVIYFVHWQTLAVVLTGPVSTGCLKKNMYYGSRF